MINLKLVDLSVREFIEKLGSDKSAPGGGSGSALAAAMGISLTKMVGEFTTGRKRYEEYQSVVDVILEESTRLQEELILAIDKDTEAFNAVSEVFKMPRDTEEEKKARAEAMERGLKIAADSPLEMMEIIVEALKTTQKAVGKTNPNTVSDLGVAVLNLKSGLKGAWFNVLINISGIKDQEYVNDTQAKGENLLEEGVQIADSVYEEILKQL